MKAIVANQAENKQLSALRDALLPKLMSGEIDVSKIDLVQLNSHLKTRPFRRLQLLRDTSGPQAGIVCFTRKSESPAIEPSNLEVDHAHSHTRRPAGN